MDRQVDLGRDIESFMDEMVETGRYATHDEVLREGVKLVRQREQKRVELEALLLEGIAAADAGDVYDLDDVFAELTADLDAMETSRPA